MNIYDIAKEAGVSIATVSRVINNKGPVSDKTRTKIEAIMAKSEYQPSAIARGLASGSTKILPLTFGFRTMPRLPLSWNVFYLTKGIWLSFAILEKRSRTGEDISL